MVGQETHSSSFFSTFMSRVVVNDVRLSADRRRDPRVYGTTLTYYYILRVEYVPIIS